jgi:alpha-1,3-mannosyl-glycoprotein beta-1,2-N-acetylglucosaminyltransferase
LLKYRPSETNFPIIVSQDCGRHPATTQALDVYGSQITRVFQPDLSEIDVPPKEVKLKGYFKIARHYGWALNHTFYSLNYSNVLIVEDDLEIAPDFFEYFSATLPILRNDPTLWCISAWNDNGKEKRIDTNAPELLHRTDFFPGLGWMLTKELWNELSVKWPRSYWDDWMRERAQRKDRACIRPEISRTSTFGKNGVSLGTYYQTHLKFIKLNEKPVPFSTLDLSYLKKDKYDVDFVKRVYSSQVVGSVNELTKLTTDSKNNSGVEYRLVYRTQTDFRDFAKRLDIMEDLRAGVPRTAYRGVVSFMLNDHRIYIAPGANWVGY